MKRKCHVLTTEFKNALASECFVDKSLFIKDFMHLEPSNVLVTTPWGFGKTVNLEMLNITH